MSWDGVMNGGGLTDDDVYAAMAAATAHSQAAAEVHRARRRHDAPSHVISNFARACAQFAVRHVRHIATYARPTVTAFTGSKASASSAGDVGLRVPSLTAFMTAKFSQGGVEPRSPCSQ